MYVQYEHGQSYSGIFFRRISDKNSYTNIYISILNLQVVNFLVITDQTVQIPALILTVVTVT